MADNLSIQITADTAPLRAQLALGQADLRAYAAEVRKTATALRTAGDDAKAGLMAQLQRQSGLLNDATASVARFKASLADVGKTGQSAFSQLGLGIGTLRGALAATGFLEAGREILGWSKSMAEAGETALNTAASLAMPLGKFIELSGAMRLMGADAEVGTRTIEHLQKSVSEGLGGNEKMLDTFQRLGISQKQLAATGGDLAAVFKLISGALQEHQGPNTAAAVYEILGTRLKAVIGFLREGAEAIDAAVKKFNDLNQSAKAAAEAGANTATKIHEVGVAASEVSDLGFLALKTSIDGVLGSATGLLSMLGRVIKAAGEVPKLDLAAINLPPGTPHEGFAGQLLHGELRPAPDRSALVRSGNRLGFAPGFLAGSPQPSPDNPNEGKGTQWAAPPKSDIKPAPIKAGGGKGGGGDTTGKDYQNFSANERLKIATAELTNQSLTGIYQEWLAEAARVYGEESAEYKRIQLEIVRAKQQSLNELGKLEKTHLDEQLKQMREAVQAANKSAKEWAAPFKTAFDSIGGTFESAIAGLINRSKPLAQTWADVAKSATSAGVALASGVASKAAGSLLGDTAGRGLGDVLGDKLLSAIGLGGGGGQAANVAALTLNTSALTANTAALAVSGAAGAAGAAGSALGGIGSALGGVGSLVGAGLAPETGGLSMLIGPMLSFMGSAGNAARGWAIPNYAGGGVVNVNAHGGEHIIPREIAQRYEAGAPGGGGDTHVHPTVVINGPADAAQVARFFRDNHGHISDSLMRAFRSNSLTPRTF